MVCRKLLIAFVASLSFAIHSAYADSDSIKYDVESWLDVPIKGYAEQTDMSPPDYCHFLVESNPATKFRCVVVQFQNKKYIILNKAESDPSMELERAVSGDACDPTALEYSNNFWKLYFSYLNYSENKETHVANTKEDRDAARRSLDTLADQPLSRFKEFLAPLTCRNARVASALLLQFGTVCRAQPEISEKLMLDPDWSIRNSATQCVSKWITSKDLDTQKRLIDNAFKQMQFIHHTDRNKSIGLIMTATTRNKEIAQYVSKNYLSQLDQLGKIAKIPNIKDSVKAIQLAAHEADPETH